MSTGSRLTLVGLVLWLPLIGCQQPSSRDLERSTGETVAWREVGDVVLAADSPSGGAVAANKAPTMTSRPASGPATQPATPLPYSIPVGVGQPLVVTALTMMPAALVSPSRTDAQAFSDGAIGKAYMRSSASVFTGEGLTPARLESIGKQGYQRGQPLRSGFLLGTSIFTPRANPSASRCQELVRGGFFPNMAACQSSFRR